MANPFRRAWEGLTFAIGARDTQPLGFQQWVDYFTVNGTSYPIFPHTTYPGREESIGSGYEGLIAYAYEGNGIVFACESRRIMLFSQARFEWKGRTGNTFSNSDLAVLENPWPGGTTADLLAQMETDAGLAGNSFVWRRGNRLVPLRPDWVTVVAGSPNNPDVDRWDPEAEVLGYIYHPGGKASGRDPIPILAEQVAHYAPQPDPLSRFIGLSWLNPVITEVMGDTAATKHKLAFFENGATVNLAVVTPAADFQSFDQWVKAFKAQFESNHVGAMNAYKTLYLGAGADAKVIGTDFRQMDFKVTQGAGETRVAAAANVPPIVVGLSEGLQAATYSNYGQARRAFGDSMHWNWTNACGSLERVLAVPEGARLSVKTDEIPFLREDETDAAAIFKEKATSLQVLVNSGWEPDSSKAAVAANDPSLLKHTGLLSVQLQPPGSSNPGTLDGAVQKLIDGAQQTPPNGNGKTPAKAAP